MKNYQPESRKGQDVAKKNLEPIKVGSGVKPPSLHGDHTAENKRALSGNLANEVDLGDDLALDVRKAVTLDYIEGGDEAAVDGRISEFKMYNPELIDHSDTDDLYPKAG